MSILISTNRSCHTEANVSTNVVDSETIILLFKLCLLTLQQLMLGNRAIGKGVLHVQRCSGQGLYLR